MHWKKVAGPLSNECDNQYVTYTTINLALFGYFSRVEIFV
jgi:hypothetical protein